MNWTAIGAIANIVAAVGVIGSLIYLSLQIKQSTRTERARAFQDIFAGFTAQNLEMFGPNNIDLIISGMQDFDGVLEKMIRQRVIGREVGLAYSTNPGNLELELADFDENAPA